MINPPFVLPFGDPRCRDVRLSGGKGASLATMTQVKLPVPPGFVVTSAAFAATVDEEKLRACCRAKNMAGARAIVATATPPVALVTEHFSTLKGLVAVRSSACAEDFEGASYAGQQETYLNVDGLNVVLEKIVECWLSFFTDRAVFYRTEKGSLEDIAMAVVIQQMLDFEEVRSALHCRSGARPQRSHGRRGRVRPRRKRGQWRTYPRPLLAGPQGNNQAEPRYCRAGPRRTGGEATG